MLKKLLFALTLFGATASFAATDVNKATAAELDAIKGIGPALSSKILNERKKGDFKDWSDLMARVKGIRDKSAVKYSTQGLTVHDTSFLGAPAAPVTKK